MTLPAQTVDLPVTVDFEGAYGAEPEEAAANVARIVSAGATGINFEDGIIGGNGIHDTAFQCRRIEAIRAEAGTLGVTLFINACTDLFLQAESAASHAALLEAATERAQAYAQAGASGFFVPGLADEHVIKALCAASLQPVNIMTREGGLSASRLGTLGVRRISYGPLPYRRCMQEFSRQASAVM